MKLLDLYILRQLVLTLVFTIVALCIIFIVVNLLENLDKFLDSKANFETIAMYYIYLLPEILKILTPVAMLVSNLFIIGKLSTNNEITAMKSGSMSIYRIMVPLGLLSLLLSFGQLYFNGWIVPKATEAKLEIERKYLFNSRGKGPINNLYMRDNPLRNVIIQYYDANQKTGTGVIIEEFTDTDKPRYAKRTEAEKIVWDSTKNVWVLENVIERQFSGNNINVVQEKKLESNLKITHSQILKLQKIPDEMTFDEQKEYIDLLKQGGKDVRKVLIEYYGNYAFPFANFIVVLFAVPFASVRRKGGIAVQIATAMGVSFFYLVFLKVSQTIAFSAGLDPLISGWSANIIFLIFGLVTIFKTKT